MENLVLFVHLVTAIAIIVLILIQRGKGAEMGASFGAGASQTLFGAGGSGNFFSRMTAVLAFVFFVTSFGLAVIAKKSTEIDVDIPLPELKIEDSEIPVVEGGAVKSEDSDIPVVENTVESAVDNDLPVVEENP